MWVIRYEHKCMCGINLQFLRNWKLNSCKADWFPKLKKWIHEKLWKSVGCGGDLALDH